jgi:hypothetical protein
MVLRHPDGANRGVRRAPAEVLTSGEVNA